MNDPFVRRYWTWNPAAATPPRHYHPKPMQNQKSEPEQQQQQPAASRPKRVVSIPVVDGTEEKQRTFRVSRPDLAAVRIQSAARGFLVRKGVRAVRRLEADVEEIERRVRSSLDLLLGDERERLRVNESLMSVLLKLDGVRGARDYRRRVIRKAISLQEAMDSISGERGGVPTAEECDRSGCASAEEGSVVTGDGAGAADREGGAAMGSPVGEDVGALDSPQASTTADSVEKTVKAESKVAAGALGSVERADDAEAKDLVDDFVMVDSKAGDSEEASATAAEIPAERSECEREEVRDSGVEIGSADKGPGPAEGGEEKGMKEVMKRTLEENARLEAVVAELLEKNAAQCRMICRLSRRIEDLERKVEMMGRKKRKQHAVPAVTAAKPESDGKGDDGRDRLP